VRQSRFPAAQGAGPDDAQPAGVLGLPAGTLASAPPPNICIFDPDEAWTYDAKKGYSKSSNSPWKRPDAARRVKTTIVDGRIVFPLAAS